MRPPRDKWKCWGKNSVGGEICYEIERLWTPITFQTEKIRLLLVKMPSKCINRMFCVVINTL